MSRKALSSIKAMSFRALCSHLFAVVVVAAAAQTVNGGQREQRQQQVPEPALCATARQKGTTVSTACTLVRVNHTGSQAKQRHVVDRSENACQAVTVLTRDEEAEHLAADARRQQLAQQHLRIANTRHD